MSYQSIMSMPVIAFWTMASMISRISAEFDIRELTVSNAAQSSDGSKSVREHLVIEMGQPYEKDPLKVQPDAGGIDKLRSLAGL